MSCILIEGPVVAVVDLELVAWSAADPGQLDVWDGIVVPRWIGLAHGLFSFFYFGYFYATYS